MQPYIMPRLEAIKLQTSLEIGEGLEWLIESDEKDIENEIHRKLGIGNYSGDKGLA